MVDLRARGLSFASLVLFTDAVAGSLGISVLPYFTESIGGTKRDFGMMISTFATANILASLWIGAASDKLGRMPLIISSLIGMSLGFIGTGITTSVTLLFVSRFALGFFAGVGATARAYIAEICTSAEEKAKQMANVGGLMMFGYAAGPPIGSALQGIVGLLGFDFGLRTPFIAGATLSVGMSIAVAVFMPREEDIKADNKAKESAAAIADPTNTDSVPASAKTDEDAPPAPLTTASLIAMGALLLGQVFAQVGSALFMVIVPLFISDMFGWGSAEFSLCMTFFILAMAFTQMLLFPKAQKAFGMLRLGVVASAVVALTFVAISVPGGMLLWLGALIVQVLSYGLSAPIVSVKIAELAPKDKLGLAMGLMSTAEQIGRVFAPTLAALAYETYGAAFTYQAAVIPALGSTACYVVVAVVEAREKLKAAVLKPGEKLKAAIRKIRLQSSVSRAFTSAADGTDRLRDEESMRALQVETSTSALDGFMGLSPSIASKRRMSEAMEHMLQLSVREEMAEENAKAPDAKKKTELM